jgi:hypothetical protein
MRAYVCVCVCVRESLYPYENPVLFLNVLKYAHLLMCVCMCPHVQVIIFHQIDLFYIAALQCSNCSAQPELTLKISYIICFYPGI